MIALHTRNQPRKPWLLIALLSTSILHIAISTPFTYTPPPTFQQKNVAASTDAHHGTTCAALPAMFAKVATEQAADYMNRSLVQLEIPNPGAERILIASIMSIERYNLSVRTLHVEHALPQGCSPTYIKARYIPDTVQVQFTGVHFKIAVQYDVHQLGIHAGSGLATMTVTGSLWLDGISLGLPQINQGQATTIGCGGSLDIEELKFHGDYHHTEGIFTSDAIIHKPDIVGYVCDGHETQNHNLVATGWQWIGPGDQPPGLRDRVARYIQVACAHPTLIERACGTCILPYAWPAAAMHAMAETWTSDPIGTILYTFTAIYTVLYCNAKTHRLFTNIFYKP